MKRSHEDSVSNKIRAELRVEWGTQAEADLEKLAKRNAARIRHAVAIFAKHQGGNVQRLKGAGLPRYRLRVGSMRVIFRREEDRVQVRRVLQRREAFRRSARSHQEVPASDQIAEDRSPADAGTSAQQVCAPSGGSGIADSS